MKWAVLTFLCLFVVTVGTSYVRTHCFRRDHLDGEVIALNLFAVLFFVIDLGLFITWGLMQ